jgi:hypothetical protein
MVKKYSEGDARVWSKGWSMDGDFDERVLSCVDESPLVADVVELADGAAATDGGGVRTSRLLVIGPNTGP